MLSHRVSRGWMGVIGLLLMAGGLHAQDEWLPEDPAVVSSSGWMQSPVDDYYARASLTHRTAGAGYENGFTDVRLWTPLIHSLDSTALTYLDTALLLDDSAEVGFNAALGYRIYLDQWERVVGGYVAYDQREHASGNASQVAAGFESLGQIEVRGNVYFAVEGSQARVAYAYDNPTFVDQYILLDQFTNYQATANVWDLELGGAVPRLEDYLSIYGGAYGIYGDDQPDAYGWKLRLETQLGDLSRLWLKVTNDPMFDTNVVFGASFYFPGILRRNLGGTPDWRALLQEPLIRNEAVVVAESTVESKSYAINPTTGSAQTVAHVDPNAATNGDGQVQSPYNNLVAATMAADPYSIIFVRRQDGSVGTNLGGTIILKEGHRLLGDGVHHTFTATQGTYELPGYTAGNRPELISSGINLRLNDETEVAGFHFRDIHNESIYGSFVKNVTIRENRFEHSNSTQVNIIDITPAGLGGVTRIVDNEFEVVSSSSTKSINATLVGDSTLIVEGNSLLTNTGSNGIQSIDIQTQGSGNRNIQVLNNEVFHWADGSDSAGIRLLYTGDTTAVVQGNHVTMGDGFHGITVDGNGTTLDLTVHNNLLDVKPNASTLTSPLFINQQTSGYSIARVTNNNVSINTTGIVVENGYELNLSSTGTADMIFADNHLELNGLFPLEDGVVVEVANAANANLNFTRNTLLGAPNHNQLSVSLATNSVLNMRMESNTITDASEFALASGSVLNFEVFHGQTPDTALDPADVANQNSMLAPTFSITSATAERAAPNSLPIPNP